MFVGNFNEVVQDLILGEIATLNLNILGNIIEINCRNGILPYAPPVGETIRFELGEHVLIIDLYKQPLAE